MFCRRGWHWNSGVRDASKFIISLHLPHSQRTDCIDVWHDTTQDLRRVLSGLRYTCEVYIGADLNVDSDSSDSPSEFERHLLLQQWMLDWQLSISRPDKPTWYNTRGSSSRLDYVLARVPLLHKGTDRVHWLVLIMNVYLLS